jgi:tetratricopeptide (TPR) repeat protein
MIESFQVLSNKSATSQQLLMIAESLHAEGKITEAIMYYDIVLVLAPNDTGALYDKGLALDVLGLHGDAITYYDKVLSVWPDNINALVNKGRALADLGRYYEAIEYFDKVLALDPSNVLAAENKELAEELAESYVSTESPFSVN